MPRIGVAHTLYHQHPPTPCADYKVLWGPEALESKPEGGILWPLTAKQGVIEAEDVHSGGRRRSRLFSDPNAGHWSPEGVYVDETIPSTHAVRGEWSKMEKGQV
jgi:hypothetical protein